MVWQVGPAICPGPVMRGGLMGRVVRSIACGAVLALLAVVPLASTADAATCTTSWKKPADGFWDVASNWTNGKPTSTSNACMAALATPYTVTVRGTVRAKTLIVGFESLKLLADDVHGDAVLNVSGGVTSDAVTYLDTTSATARPRIVTGASAFVNRQIINVDTDARIDRLTNV